MAGLPNLLVWCFFVTEADKAHLQAAESFSPAAANVFGEQQVVLVLGRWCDKYVQSFSCITLIFTGISNLLVWPSVTPFSWKQRNHSLAWDHFALHHFEIVINGSTPAKNNYGEFSIIWWKKTNIAEKHGWCKYQEQSWNQLSQDQPDLGVSLHFTPLTVQVGEAVHSFMQSTWP